MVHEWTTWDMFKDSLKNKKSSEPPFDKKHNSWMNIIKFRTLGIRPTYDSKYVNEILQIDREIEKIKIKYGEGTPTQVRNIDKCTRLISYCVNGKIYSIFIPILPPGSEWCPSCPSTKKTLSEFLKYIIFSKYNFLMCFNAYDR